MGRKVIGSSYYFPANAGKRKIALLPKMFKNIFAVRFFYLQRGMHLFRCTTESISVLALLTKL